MLDRWLDRDDLTDEDLHEMTAEEEVMDWIVGSPVPAARRPSYLPDDGTMESGPRAPLPPAPAPPPTWPLLVAAVVVAATGLGLFALSMGMLTAWWVMR